ncbi:FapA family protein, partial [Campylobacter coli]|uniref:FapA family protein n=1 Tax=Campylobacter coli TaxID=195 RepID=UPI0005771F9B
GGGIDEFSSKNLRNFQSFRKFKSRTSKHKSDEIIYHRDVNEECFDENNSYDEGIYCKPVEKNELLFEYIYRFLGKEGRNLRGEILHLNPIAFLDNPFIIKDESIYTEELEDRIKYFSANYGFLNKDHSGYSVINNLKLSQIGLKTTGSIKTNTDENINLEITNFDISDDAIKSGIVNVQASNIKVNGSIGATKLYGKNISIKGLTHAKSEIFAQDIFITTHKGTLQADTVYIKNLENGTIIAKNVFVENCMGGKIEAENIYICNLLTDNTLYPRKNLIITNNINFKNNIVVSPLVSIENNSDTECENLKNLSLKIKSKLDDTISKMQNYYDYLIKNQIKIIKLQKTKNPSAIEMKFSNLYHDIIKKYNHLSISYKKFIKLKYQIDAKLNFLNEMVYNVKIYIKAENIGEDNFLKFYPNTNTNLELKHHINLKDYEKVLYLEKGQQVSYIKSSYNYSESDIEEIKIIFEKLEKDNS